jgi:phosphatidylserine/phosphatidylglycerophosphate/cardiolipin synthase-like enzyme
MEHQHIEVPQIIDCLAGALRRGVEVVAVVPAAGKMTDELRLLCGFEGFLLAGISGVGTDGRRCPVWVHAKLMLVDGSWGTIGSCNLHRASLLGNGELNVAFFDAATVRALRVELFLEHLGRDTSGLDEREAFRLFREIARENRKKADVGRADWEGLACCL